MKPSPRQFERGQIMILAAFALTALLAMVGLAIDSGRGYGVKAKLNSAVDAAAIAGARALASGETDAARIDNARAAVQNYYAANFPANYFGANRGAVAADAVHSNDGRWTISVTATATMPATFLNVVGQGNVNISASSQAIRRDLDLILVMDTSGSLDLPSSPSGTFQTLQAAAISFVSKFNSGANGDRIGLVSFASGAVVDVPIVKDGSRGFNRTAVTNAINALDPSGGTASAEGLRVALNELNGVPAVSRSSLRVIVFFSDGAPNGVPAAFAGVTGDLYSETNGNGSAPKRVFRYDQRDSQLGNYSIATLPNSGFSITGVGNIPLAGRRALGAAPYANTRCNANMAARNMVENVANTARGQAIKIYSIGLGADLNSVEIKHCDFSDDPAENGANILKRLANTSDVDTYNPAQPQGRYASAASAADLSDAFTAIASEILRLSM